MTAAHYLAFPGNGQAARAPISATNNPFGVLRGPPYVYSNLDVRMYFSTSRYQPLPPIQTPYIYVGFGYGLCQTYDWAIGYDYQGYMTFSQERFNYPERNGELGSYQESVKSTVPISFDNLSPNGLFVRAYINAYGTGPADSPGQGQATPNITFFTSNDAGVSFVQLGDTVPLKTKEITEATSMIYLSALGPQICGPLIELQPVWTTNAVYLTGGTNPPSNVPVPYNTYIPDMRVLMFSMQDSNGRYLVNVDFTQGIPFTTTVLQPYTTDPAALALDTSYSFRDSTGAPWTTVNGAVLV